MKIKFTLTHKQIIDILLIVLTVAMLILGLIYGPNAHAAPDSGYGAGEARRQMSVNEGVVLQVRVTEVEGDNTGKFAGAALGGAIGTAIGYQTSNRNFGGGALGASIGSLFGGFVGDRASRSQGLEFIVRLGDGRVVAVAQAMDAEGTSIRVGDHVALINGSSTRVVRATW